MSVARRLPSALMQISPGMTHPPSRLCLSDIRRSVLCRFWALTIFAASPRYNASYPLPVRQASALPSASSRSAVAHGTLAVRLTLPLAGRVEDFHLQVSAPCRAHKSKGRRAFAPSLLTAGLGIIINVPVLDYAYLPRADLAFFCFHLEFRLFLRLCADVCHANAQKQTGTLRTEIRLA